MKLPLCTSNLGGQGSHTHTGLVCRSKVGIFELYEAQIKILSINEYCNMDSRYFLNTAQRTFFASNGLLITDDHQIFTRPGGKVKKKTLLSYSTDQEKRLKDLQVIFMSQLLVIEEYDVWK